MFQDIMFESVVKSVVKSEKVNLTCRIDQKTVNLNPEDRGN